MILVAQGEYWGVTVPDHLASVVISVRLLCFAQDDDAEALGMHDQHTPDPIWPTQHAKRAAMIFMLAAQTFETINLSDGESDFAQ
ncbi:hypothetical protein BK666_08940 [Pseudomonas frederiksbergensis]|uniref:Uncharacterized protein n=1 Tax=Pseudomonas frederiksbergensis TaxID=104087 RepID=A0A423K9L4_9PSED|nr:hypothetical protein BK666_08940 [Pseudomonas frederiksbergensis]